MPSSGRVISCCLSTRCNISDTSVRASIYAGLRQRVASSSTLCCPAMRVRTTGELSLRTTAFPLSRTAGLALSADPCSNNFMSCAVQLALLYSHAGDMRLAFAHANVLTKGVFILSLLGLLQHALQSGPTLRSHRSCPTVVWFVCPFSLAPLSTTRTPLRTCSDNCVKIKHWPTLRVTLMIHGSVTSYT